MNTLILSTIFTLLVIQLSESAEVSVDAGTGSGDKRSQKFEDKSEIDVTCKVKFDILKPEKPESFHSVNFWKDNQTFFNYLMDNETQAYNQTGIIADNVKLYKPEPATTAAPVTGTTPTTIAPTTTVPTTTVSTTTSATTLKPSFIVEKDIKVLIKGAVKETEGEYRCRFYYNDNVTYVDSDASTLTFTNNALTNTLSIGTMLVSFVFLLNNNFSLV